MRILDKARRPVVEFNPASAQHRRLFRQFMQTGSWRDSPVQFALDERFLSLPAYLTHVVAEHYMDLDRRLVK